MASIVRELTVKLPIPHPAQEKILNSVAKRKIIRAGRRSGKTVVAAIMAVEAFLKERRILYTAPTTEQVDTFWYEIKQALAEPITVGIYTKNETEHIIERRNTENRIQCRTAWSADMIRGSYADLLIMDEFQLCNEDLWAVVGAPMLLDNNGDAVFIYTPPSLHSIGVSKAKDPRHAAQMFKDAKGDTSGRWETFCFTSRENPHISSQALEDITKDMSQVSYKQEILAEDEEDKAWFGLVYKSFNYRTCVIPRFPIPQNWLVYSGHDFGGANPAAMFYAQDPATGFFYAFQEYLPGAGLSISDHIVKFKEIVAGYNVLKRVGGSHQEGEIRQGYTAQGWAIQEPKQKTVLAGIDRVISLHELNKVFVFEDLFNYLFEKSNYSWKLDKAGKATDEIQDKAKFHLLDAERYILSDFAPETAVVRKASPVWTF